MSTHLAIARAQLDRAVPIRGRTHEVEGVEGVDGFDDPFGKCVDRHGQVHG